MQILHSDLEDEVRDGFYVDSMMKCCWAAQLNVLEKIDRICRKHNIQYQAEWGTLLGTVRHGGFIPWDDDMDISMKRNDYNKFNKIAQKELPKGYFLRNYSTDKGYWDVISRVVNTRGYHTEHEFLDKNFYFPFPAGIDIFPLDFIPKDQDEGELLRELVNEVKSIADNYGAGYLKGEELEECLKLLEEHCNMKIPRDENLHENLYKIVVSLYSLYQEKESDDIILMALWIEKDRKGYPKEYYSKTTRLPYAQSSIPVPIAYDSILKQKYGDYMKMVRKGGSHDYPYYKSIIKELEGHGVDFGFYKYENRVIRNKESERKIGIGEDNLQIMEKIHLNICKLLIVQDKETAMQLLVNCQDCAVSLGDKIEKLAGNCEQIIVTLEEYCELIFQIYQILDSGGELDAEGLYGILQEQLSVIRNAYEKEYKQKKKIVFVTDKASRWNSLESVWKAAKEDENNIVSVIVAPYCYKRIDNTIIEEHYEGELFPEYVNVVDYRTCDLEQYHPDIIYINSPYDEYNYFTNIHQDFYSSKLVNYCDKLVYIPWFMIAELTCEDERGWQSMQHFVTMPGVVNADQVIVQSEQMKEAYVDYLTDWAGEDTRALWEKKILGYGSPLMNLKDDKKEIEKELSENWKTYLYKSNGESKKVILYHISSASFIDYKEKAVDKLKRVLKIFKENKEEICLLWYWDVVMEETLRNGYPKIWKEFKNITEQYKKERWGIYEEHPNKELMVCLSDAYYGDGSAVSQNMVIAEKPVMLQNFDC